MHLQRSQTAGSGPLIFRGKYVPAKWEKIIAVLNDMFLQKLDQIKMCLDEKLKYK